MPGRATLGHEHPLSGSPPRCDHSRSPWRSASASCALADDPKAAEGPAHHGRMLPRLHCPEDDHQGRPRSRGPTSRSPSSSRAGQARRSRSRHTTRTIGPRLRHRPARRVLRRHQGPGVDQEDRLAPQERRAGCGDPLRDASLSRQAPTSVVRRAPAAWPRAATARGDPVEVVNRAPMRPDHEGLRPCAGPQPGQRRALPGSSKVWATANWQPLRRRHEQGDRQGRGLRLDQSVAPARTGPASSARRSATTTKLSPATSSSTSSHGAPSWACDRLDKDHLKPPSRPRLASTWPGGGRRSRPHRGNGQEQPARNAVDGDPGTRWCASSDRYPRWWQVDLHARMITGVRSSEPLGIGRDGTMQGRGIVHDRRDAARRCVEE